VTPLEGIRNKVGPGVRVRYIADNSNNSDAANLAAESDVAIVFVGNNPTATRHSAGDARRAKARRPWTARPSNWSQRKPNWSSA